MSDSYLPKKEMVPFCPFAPDGICKSNCMLLLTFTNKDDVGGVPDHGEGVCALAAGLPNRLDLNVKVISF